MRKWLDKTTALVLCGALVLAACGDDDEAAPVEPEPEPVAEITPEIIGLYGTLVSSFQTVFFAVLVGTESVPGEGGGSVEIAGNEWTLQDYSPDGALIINGVLNIDITQTPIPLTGTVILSGSQEAEVVLDMAIAVEGTAASTGRPSRSWLPRWASTRPTCSSTSPSPSPPCRRGASSSRT